MAVAPKTVMIIGLGKLGGPVLDLLAMRYPMHRFVCIARDAHALGLRANLSRYLAAQWGSYPRVHTAACDIRDVEATVACLSAHAPDVLFNATTSFPWWRIADLPGDAATLAEKAGPGMWSAVDCLLPFRLTEAIAASGLRPVFVNGCYPDLTNAFLAGRDGAPKLGIGNLSNLVPGLRLAFADELGVEANAVDVRLVAHHYVSWNAPTSAGAAGAPFHLTINHPGGKLTFEGPNDDSCFALLRRRASRTRGLAGLGVTIGSAATVLASILEGSDALLHCPGADGLPGGYPVRVSDSGAVQLDLGPGLEYETAVSINRAAQRFDGTESVKPGLVVPTDRARTAFQQIVGETLPDVSYENVGEVASLTLDRLNARYGLGVR